MHADRVQTLDQHYLDISTLPLAEDLLREVSGVYAACRLGSHEPAPGAVLTFSPGDATALCMDADLDAAAGVALTCIFSLHYTS